MPGEHLGTLHSVRVGGNTVAGGQYGDLGLWSYCYREIAICLESTLCTQQFTGGKESSNWRANWLTLDLVKLPRSSYACEVLSVLYSIQVGGCTVSGGYYVDLGPWSNC